MKESPKKKLIIKEYFGLRLKVLKFFLKFQVFVKKNLLRTLFDSIDLRQSAAETSGVIHLATAEDGWQSTSSRGHLAMGACGNNIH